MVDNIFDIPWTKGVYGEVVTEDCYKLKEIIWQPDVIFDIGANVGIFTRYARELFPNAKIIAIEPSPRNYMLLCNFTNDPNAIGLNKAIGHGILVHHGGNPDGGNQVYTSIGLGYPEKEVREAIVEKEEDNHLGNMVISHIETILPDKLIEEYVKEGNKVLMKIDCEGGENAIWTHQPSLDKMKTIDHVVMELHYFAITSGEIYEQMKKQTLSAIMQFLETHNITLTNTMFTAIKK